MEHSLAAGGECRRHETQFDERFHPDRQEEITDLIGVEERVEQQVPFIYERPHIVAQQPVKASMEKAKLLMALL
jgi:hypothetical protein